MYLIYDFLFGSFSLTNKVSRIPIINNEEVNYESNWFLIRIDERTPED